MPRTKQRTRIQDFIVTGGDAIVGSDGFTLTIQGFDETVAGSADGVLVRGGNRSGIGAGGGGPAELRGGSAGSSGVGGAATVQGGDGLGTNTNGGAVTITGGAGTGTEDGGNINLTPGVAAGAGIDGEVFITGKLNVSGGIDPTYLGLNEQGSQPFSVTGGIGFFWVDSTVSPHRFVLTDEAGNNIYISCAGGLSCGTSTALLRGADGVAAVGQNAQILGGTGAATFNGGDAIVEGGLAGAGGVDGDVTFTRGNLVHSSPTFTDVTRTDAISVSEYSILIAAVATGAGKDLHLTAGDTSDATFDGGNLILEVGTEGAGGTRGIVEFRTDTIEPQPATAVEFAILLPTVGSGDGNDFRLQAAGTTDAGFDAGDIILALQSGGAGGVDGRVVFKDPADTVRSYVDLSTASSTEFTGAPSTGAAVAGENIAIFGGVQASVSATAKAGDVVLASGSVTDGGSSADAGKILLLPGSNAGSGAVGIVDVTGDVVISGKLTVGGLIDPTGLVLDEQATVPFVTTSAKGTLWLRSDTVQTLMLTDDAGTDIEVAGGGATRMQEMLLSVQNVNRDALTFASLAGGLPNGGVPAALGQNINSRIQYIEFGKSTEDDIGASWDFVLPTTYSGKGLTVEFWVAGDGVPSPSAAASFTGTFDRQETGRDIDTGALWGTSIAATGTTITAPVSPAQTTVMGTIVFTNAQIDGMLVGESGRVAIMRLQSDAYAGVVRFTMGRIYETP